MKKIAINAALLCLLSGCAGVPVAASVLAAQAGLAAAMDTYCTSTTEEAKQALRDSVSGGVKVLPCQPSN